MYYEDNYHANNEENKTTLNLHAKLKSTNANFLTGVKPIQ